MEVTCAARRVCDVFDGAGVRQRTEVGALVRAFVRIPLSTVTRPVTGRSARCPPFTGAAGAGGWVAQASSRSAWAAALISAISRVAPRAPAGSPAKRSGWWARARRRRAARISSGLAPGSTPRMLCGVRRVDIETKCSPLPYDRGVRRELPCVIYSRRWRSRAPSSGSTHQCRSSGVRLHCAGT